MTFPMQLQLTVENIVQHLLKKNRKKLSSAPTNLEFIGYRSALLDVLFTLHKGIEDEDN